MKYFCALIIYCSFGALQAQHEYVVKGTFMPLDSVQEVILSTYDPILQERKEVGRAHVKLTGKFEIKFQFSHPDLFRIDFPLRKSTYLVINDGQKSITLDLMPDGNFEVRGSKDTEKLLAYDQFRKESNLKLVRPTYDAMKAASKIEDQQAEIAAVEAYVHNSKLHRKELIDFTEKEIGNSIALYGTVLRWTGDDEVNRLEKLVENFAYKYPDLPMTEKMIAKVHRFKKVAIGAQVEDIKGMDLNGNPITLYDHLGKYTLIDFWASWCSPCILQIPDLQKVHSEFHDKGFEIFSYSVDRSEKKWIEAAKKYDMPWLHASDVQGWQSQVAADYNVTFVPFNFLLDEEGNIIAKNLHHKTLYNFLSELMGASISE